MVRFVKFLVRTTVRVVTSVLALSAVLGAVWFAGMRTKWPPVVDFQRRVNRRVVNPRQMRTAGTPGSKTAIVRHVGRRSGTPYETPVVPFQRDDRFVIALPYGSRPDWVQNVLAAESAELVHDGQTYTVGSARVRPILPDDVPDSELKLQRAFGNTQCLEVTRLPAA